MKNAESSQVADIDMTSGDWEIAVWNYDKATPPRKELIVQSSEVAIASFNWDEGRENPFTPTEA